MLAPPGAPHILIVDDEIGPRESLRILFKRDYHMSFAECGKEALSVLGRSGLTFELMITCIRMPGMTGLELLEHATRDHPSMPVIMLTGFGAEETIMRALRAGAFEYFKKPFQVETLVPAVEMAIRFSRILRNGGPVDEELDIRKRQTLAEIDALIAPLESARKTLNIVGNDPSIWPEIPLNVGRAAPKASFRLNQIHVLMKKIVEQQNG